MNQITITQRQAREVYELLKNIESNITFAMLLVSPRKKKKLALEKN